MSIFLTETSKVIVQGMTGSEGHKHTRRMIVSGTSIDTHASAPPFSSPADPIASSSSRISETCSSSHCV